MSPARGGTFGPRPPAPGAGGAVGAGGAAGAGAAVPARPQPITAGGFSRPLPGYVECGDAFVIERLGRLGGAPPEARGPRGEGGESGEGGGELLVAVVDGLGHGKEARVAAEAATQAVLAHRGLPLEEILRHCDRQLQPTRGAAMGVLRLAADGRGEFCGIGNIEVQSLSGPPAGVFCLPGIVGHSLRSLRTMPFTLQNGDVVCLHTDGVSGRGNLRSCLPGAPEAVARCIVDGWGRPHDDATAVVLGYGAAATTRPPAGTAGTAGAAGKAGREGNEGGDRRQAGRRP